MKLVPFESLGAVSYSPSIVTVAISCIVARYSDLLVEDREIFIPNLYLAPPQGGDPVGIFVKMFDANKTSMIGYRMVKKNYDNMLSRFHLIPERHGRTDGQNCYIIIARVSVLTRDKKHLASIWCAKL